MPSAAPPGPPRLLPVVDAGTDWPLQDVPRAKLESFRAPARRKAWSTTTFLLARHPDTWAKLLLALGSQSRSTEDVGAIFAKELGQPLGELEAEWRDWVRAGSRFGKASGLPQ